jgi:hypothetical protein
MASDYGLCCMGAECCMPNKTVTFNHRCIRCSGFLHVVCGVTDNDDHTTCKKCLGSYGRLLLLFWKRRIRRRRPMFPLDHNKRVR